MSLNAVPIVDVHVDNFRQFWPSILLAVKTSSFVALDLELSGLGNRKLLNASSVEDRYNAISKAAKTRSIISLGLSCFKLLDDDTGPNKPGHQMWKYYVQTYNITTLCSQDFIVEPEALKFLVSHGFDFNKQYSKGVPYYKGNDKDDDRLEPSIRNLFLEILKSKRSLVLHNGLVDLVFMYQCWYADLPGSMASFSADLYEACSGGIYDTKYIAEFKARTSASYLEYVFRKLQRENETKANANRAHVSLSFMKFTPDMPYVEYRQLGVDTTGQNTVPPKDICMTYAYHGWCPKADTCSLSHNVDCVLDMEGGVINRKKKRKLPQMQVCDSYASLKKIKKNCSAGEFEIDKVATEDLSSSEVCPHSPPQLVTNSKHVPSENPEPAILVEGVKEVSQTNLLSKDSPNAEDDKQLLKPCTHQQKSVEKSGIKVLAEGSSSPVKTRENSNLDTKESPTPLVNESEGELTSAVPLGSHDIEESALLATEESEEQTVSSMKKLADCVSTVKLKLNLSNSTDECKEDDNEIPNREVSKDKFNQDGSTQAKDKLTPENGSVNTVKDGIDQADESLSTSNKGHNSSMDEKSSDLTSDTCTESTTRLEQKSRGHRAGCDAFMTGFIMAIFMARYGVRPAKASQFSAEETHTQELLNKMYLSGKSVPFLVWKSEYTKTSKRHQEKTLKHA